jgi:hypothetical protein
LLADAVDEELEAVVEPLGGIGGKGRGGELVLDPADGQLRLPGAAFGQLGLGLFFDGVAEHVMERGKGGPAGPVGRHPRGLEDLDDLVAGQDGVGLGHVGAGHDPGAIAVGQEHLA